MAHKSFGGFSLRDEEGRDTALAGRVCDNVCSCTVMWFAYLQLGWGLLKKKREKKQKQTTTNLAQKGEGERERTKGFVLCFRYHVHWSMMNGRVGGRQGGMRHRHFWKTFRGWLSREAASRELSGLQVREPPMTQKSRGFYLSF